MTTATPTPRRRSQRRGRSPNTTQGRQRILALPLPERRHYWRARLAEARQCLSARADRDAPPPLPERASLFDLIDVLAWLRADQDDMPVQSMPERLARLLVERPELRAYGQVLLQTLEELRWL